MTGNRAPWWDRGVSPAGAFALSALLAVLAVLNLGLAFGGVIAKSLWEISLPYLLGSGVFLVLAVARRKRGSQRRPVR